MLTYLIRRLILIVPTLLGMTAVVFFVMALSPGGIGGAILASKGKGNGADAVKVREYYAKRYHLNDKPYIQYFRWLNEISPVGFEVKDDGGYGTFGLKWPSLGESMSHRRPVSDLILESLPLTLLLNFISLPIIYISGTLGGIRAAGNRGRFFDTGFGTAQLMTWSMPTILVGVLLIGYFANREYFLWFPSSGLLDSDAGRMPFLPGQGDDGWTRGWLLDVLWHLVLPVFCLTYGGSAFITKLVRGSVLENLSADYTRTARAKGVSETGVLYRHVFRNSLLSLITVAASLLPATLAGSIIVEKVFSIPGMGRLGVDAASSQDRELVLAVTLIGGLVTLLSGLVRDALYAVADPRVTYG